MAPFSRRLAAIVALSLAAAAIMVLRAALAFGRNPLLDTGNLLPPALAFCLAGWFLRNRPTLLTLLLVVVASVSGVCILIYLLGDSLSVVIAWGVQWLTALAAIILAVIGSLLGESSKNEKNEAAEGRQPRLLTVLLGFVLGMVLGVMLCFTVFRFEFHSFEMGGTATVFVFGAEIFSISGIFANLTGLTVSALVCVVTGIAGTLVFSRLIKG